MHRRHLPLREERVFASSARRRRSVARGLARAALSVGLLVASVAGAQPAEETPGQRLFREGREALDRGEVDAACARFEESHRAEGALGPLLNLANCNEKRGRTASALADWQRAASLARPDQADQRQLAEERITALTRRVPTLSLRRAALAPVDMVVRLDGTEAIVDGAARPIDPGLHRIEISAAGRTPTTREVRLQEAQVLELTLEPGPPPVGAKAAPTRETSPADVEARTSTLLVGGLVASGVGTLGLALFGVTGVLALGASSDLDAACGTEHRCPPGDTEGRDAVARGEALLIPNAIGLGVGAVGLGVGITLLVLHATGEDDAATALRRAEEPLQIRF